MLGVKCMLWLYSCSCQQILKCVFMCFDHMSYFDRNFVQIDKFKGSRMHCGLHEACTGSIKTRTLSVCLHKRHTWATRKPCGHHEVAWAKCPISGHLAPCPLFFFFFKASSPLWSFLPSLRKPLLSHNHLDPWCFHQFQALSASIYQFFSRFCRHFVSSPLSLGMIFSLIFFWFFMDEFVWNPNQMV